MVWTFPYKCIYKHPQETHIHIMTSYACIHQISIHTQTCKHAHAHNPIHVKFAVHMSLSWLLIGTQLYTTNEFPGEFADSYTLLISYIFCMLF